MIIGFSTARITDESLAVQIRTWLGLGCNAVEFSLDTSRDLTIVRKHIDRMEKPFEYMSIHAPRPDDLYSDNPQTHEILSSLESFCAEYPIRLVNVHPVDVIDWDVFETYTLPLALENMDRDKDAAQSVSEMKTLFDRVDAKMVLDINHCYSLDPSMQLAHDMYAAFKDRIAEIHVSGISQLPHDSLYDADEQIIVDFLKDKDLPMIIESFDAQASVEELAKEYHYIKKMLA